RRLALCRPPARRFGLRAKPTLTRSGHVDLRVTDEPFCPSTRIPSRKELELMQGPPCPQKLAHVLADSWDELQKIERYERRALSRRKFAIRDFDMAVAQDVLSAETA